MRAALAREHKHTHTHFSLFSLFPLAELDDKTAQLKRLNSELQTKAFLCISESRKVRECESKLHDAERRNEQLTRDLMERNMKLEECEMILRMRQEEEEEAAAAAAEAQEMKQKREKKHTYQQQEQAGQQRDVQKGTAVVATPTPASVRRVQQRHRTARPPLTPQNGARAAFGSARKAGGGFKPTSAMRTPLRSSNVSSNDQQQHSSPSALQPHHQPDLSLCMSPIVERGSRDASALIAASPSLPSDISVAATAAGARVLTSSPSAAEDKNTSRAAHEGSSLSRIDSGSGSGSGNRSIVHYRTARERRQAYAQQNGVTADSEEQGVRDAWLASDEARSPSRSGENNSSSNQQQLLLQTDENVDGHHGGVRVSGQTMAPPKAGWGGRQEACWSGIGTGETPDVCSFAVLLLSFCWTCTQTLMLTPILLFGLPFVISETKAVTRVKIAAPQPDNSVECETQ